MVSMNIGRVENRDHDHTDIGLMFKCIGLYFFDSGGRGSGYVPKNNKTIVWHDGCIGKMGNRCTRRKDKNETLASGDVQEQGRSLDGFLRKCAYRGTKCTSILYKSIGILSKCIGRR